VSWIERNTMQTSGALDGERMKRTLWIAVLALMLPVAAWSDAIDLVYKFGSISVSNSGIVSHGSQLKQFNRVIASPGHALGSVSFSTGALLSGSILSGGTFSDVGSSFVVIGKGSQVPHKGLIFNGSFVGPISWTLVAQKGQSLTYQLGGTIQGTLWNGHFVTGATTQTIYSRNGQVSLGIGHVRIGLPAILTPEPGTLGLLGTGILAVIRKYRSRVPIRT
jgi:hypothetical protein